MANVIPGTAPSSGKLSQSQILHKLGIPTDQAEINRLDGNGRLQQYINQQATLHGLPEPFAPSTASAIIQDLLPIAGIVGAGAAASATAGSGGAAAGSGAAGAGAGESAAAGGAGGAAVKGLTSGAASTIGKAVAGLTVAGLFTNSSLWAGAAMSLLGVFLVLFGIVKLSGASPRAVAGKVIA